MPTIRRQGKRAQRPRQLDEAEEQANVVLHLRDGHGFEFVWHDDLAFQEHHRQLTVAVLRRLWPKYRTRILGERRDPGTRPWAFWAFDTPREMRDAFMSVFKREEAAWRRWRKRGCVTTPGDPDFDDDDLETLGEVQRRLLLEAGLLTADELAEIASDGYESDIHGIDNADVSWLRPADAANDTVATLSSMPSVLDGSGAGDTDTGSNPGDSH